MTGGEEVWIPLVDEPIGSVVADVQEEHPEIAELAQSPRRLLAFRTFAYIRVGILLGRLLVENDVEPDPGTNWVDELMRDPRCRQAVADEVLAVAREVASDPSLAGEPVGPSEEERARVADALERRLAGDT